MTLGTIVKNYKLDKTEVEIYLSHLLERDRSYLKAFPEHKLTSRQIKNLDNFIKQRQIYKPLAYILGYKDFFGFRFKVDQSVMVPRNETENLVELVLTYVTKTYKETSIKICDVGTGSGCIAISLTKLLPRAKIYAVDIDSNALSLAKENALVHKVESKINFLAGDLLDPLTQEVDLVVANLPYIPTARIAHLQPEISGWEPAVALDGGKDGMSLYKRLFSQSKHKLNRSGIIFYEVDGQVLTKKFGDLKRE